MTCGLQEENTKDKTVKEDQEREKEQGQPKLTKNGQFQLCSTVKSSTASKQECRSRSVTVRRQVAQECVTNVHKQEFRTRDEWKCTYKTTHESSKQEGTKVPNRQCTTMYNNTLTSLLQSVYITSCMKPLEDT